MQTSTLKPTKDIIFRSAKEEFYDNGYEKGQIRNIAVRASVPQSLVTYYFRTKDNLVSEIFKGFYNSISDLIDRYSDLNITNSLYKQIVIAHIYYDIIFNDENNKRFYMEIRQKHSSNYEMLHEASGKVISKHVDNFKISISKLDFQIYALMESAARREFFLYYFEKDLNLSIAEMVNIVEAILPRLLRIDQNIVDSYLFQAQRIVKEIDYSELKFLI